MPEFFSNQWMPFFWLILAIVLGVVEAASIQLVAIWFAIGAVVTIIPAVMDASLFVQLIVFVAASTLLLICTRPFAKKFLSVKKTKTNADSVIGRVGVVIHRIGNAAGTGRVFVGGLDWAAQSEDGEPIEEKEQVVVNRIDGVKVIVERLI